jgi:hypothetical protein
MSTDITTRITSLDASIDAADKNLAALEAVLLLTILIYI